jgi:hypothetical protein
VTDFRDAFNRDELLLWEVDSVSISWIRPSGVLINVPPFVQYTRRFPDLNLKAMQKNAFCEILGIENWDDERHLYVELSNFQLSDPTVSPETCRYIFLAFKQFASHVSDTLLSWITQQRVFPIRNPDSTKSFACCDESIFVPDSAPLNKYIEDRVRILDFGGKDVYTLLPLLRHLPLKFISSYEAHDVQIGGIPSQHSTANILLQESRNPLAR